MDYKTIGNALQIEGHQTHVDLEFMNKQGIQVPNNPSRLDGITLFNQTAIKNNLAPLNDPLGYMALKPNAYDLIHDTYKNKYQNAQDMIDNGLMQGGSHAMKAVLGKINPVVRHDITHFMPKDMKYSELHFIKPTDNMKEIVDNFVDTRVRLTYSYGLKRQVEATAFTDIKNDLNKYGNLLTSEIEQAANIVPEKQAKLSSKTLLANQNNKDALITFAAQLKHPDSIEKENQDQHATASFITKDIQTAKFLLANKDYLSEFGFNVTKSNGQIETKWQSKMVDELYQKQQLLTLDMSDLDQSQTLE